MRDVDGAGGWVKGADNDADGRVLGRIWVDASCPESSRLSPAPALPLPNLPLCPPFGAI